MSDITQEQLESILSIKEFSCSMSCKMSTDLCLLYDVCYTPYPLHQSLEYRQSVLHMILEGKGVKEIKSELLKMKSENFAAAMEETSDD